MDLKQLEQEIDRLKEIVVNLKNEKVKFEVEVPGDIETYYTVSVTGELEKVGQYREDLHKHIYKFGEAFETSESALSYYKERLLLKKLEDWAEEHNGDWYPDWEDCDDKFYIAYHYGLNCFQVCSNMRFNTFNKLPYLKNDELAREFIEEFGDEIKEVLC